MNGSLAPILVGDLRRSAEDAVDEILSALAIAPPCSKGGLNGDAGLAVLFAYAAEAGFGDSWVAIAGQKLDRALVALSSDPTEPSLWLGAAGVRWAVTSLSEPSDAAIVINHIDDALHRRLAVDVWHEPYDLMRGLVGFGVAFAEQGGTSRKLLNMTISHLDRLSVAVDGGLAWLGRRADSAFSSSDEAVTFRSSVAHGVAGVVALCARLLRTGLGSDVATRLLHGAAEWLRTRIEVVRERQTRDARRRTWCNGDLGAICALLAAGEALSDRSLADTALRLANDLVRERDDVGLVADATFCHGSAGLAHVFARLYFRTSDPEFRDEARFWLTTMLRARRPGTGIAGYLYRRRGAWVPDPSLLTGAAGTALVLMGALTERPPSWDRVFLTEI